MLCKRLPSKSFNPCPHTLARLQALIDDQPFKITLSEVTDLCVKLTIDIIEQNIASLIQISEMYKNCDGRAGIEYRPVTNEEFLRIPQFHKEIPQARLIDRLRVSNMLLAQKIEHWHGVTDQLTGMVGEAVESEIRRRA